MAEKKDTRESCAISVTVDPNRSLEGALRKFKKKVDSAGVIRELRNRKHHTKRSVARKEKRKAALKRLQKEGRKLDLETNSRL